MCADLTGVDLTGADLTGVVWNVGHANGFGPRYDAHTRWPAGFDPRKYGAILTP